MKNIFERVIVPFRVCFMTQLMTQLRYVFIILICLFLLILMTSCSLVTQKLDADKFYRHDIKVKVNGLEFEGVGVIPLSEKYEFVLLSPGKVDLMTMTNCHRDEVIKDKSRGLFANDKKVKYTFIPNELEQKKACGITFGAYEKLRGRHSFAYVEFNTDRETLPALNRCSGRSFVSSGVSVCQARAGLIQEIQFDDKTKISPDPGCEIPSGNGRVYQYPIRKGECTYYFGTKDGRLHRLVTLGYEEILLRDVHE